MKYSIDQLIATPTRNKFLFFWGHQPSKDGSITASCFSQWWISPFEYEGQVYRSAEHWMMAGKARLFNDSVTLAAILNAHTPAEAKKWGRAVRNFDPDIWDAGKFQLVVKGNWLKFSQHEALKDFLLQTGNRVIVEASPVDPVWGIGMAVTDAGVEQPGNWKGENLLGFALMEVRDQLSP